MLQKNLILLLLICQVIFSADLSLSAQAEDYILAMKWGSLGSGEGQFNLPTGIAVNSCGSNVSVVDENNHRIQEFTANGQFITQWGSYGSGAGQFNSPNGIAVDSRACNVYVSDATNGRIQKFTTDGQFVTQWKFLVDYGDDLLIPEIPLQIAVDSNGHVYVADHFDHIVKFSTDGQFVTQWRIDGLDGPLALGGIAADSSGHVYATDTFRGCILKFSTDGQFITQSQWGSYCPGRVGQSGYSAAHGIAVDSSGHVYVADLFGECIQKFTADGQVMAQWSLERHEVFNKDNAISVDSSGHVYVADSESHLIEKFVPIPQCATSNLFAPPQLFLPCVQVEGEVYQVGMNLIAVKPLRFELDEGTVQPITRTTTAQCAVFPDPSAPTLDHLRINCLQMGDKTYWVDLVLTSDNPSVILDVVKVGGVDGHYIPIQDRPVDDDSIEHIQDIPVDDGRDEHGDPIVDGEHEHIHVPSVPSEPSEPSEPKAPYNPK